MSVDRSAQITHLCEQWLSAVQPQGGGVTITTSSQQYRLLVNGLLPHALTYPELQSAYVCLTRTLLLPSSAIVIADDHLVYWAWGIEVALVGVPGLDTDPFTSHFHLRELLATIGHALLADTMGESRSPLGHVFGLVSRRHTVVTHLVFPLLEGLLRATCSQYVTMDGSVLRAFDRYGPQGQKGKSRCDSLADMLRLFETAVGKPETRQALTETRKHLNQLRPSADPYRLLADWRSDPLHGNVPDSTVWGTVLDIALLIAFDGFSTAYEQRQDKTIRNDACRQATIRPSTPSSSWIAAEGGDLMPTKPLSLSPLKGGESRESKLRTTRGSQMRVTGESE